MFSLRAIKVLVQSINSLASIYSAEYGVHFIQSIVPINQETIADQLDQEYDAAQVELADNLEAAQNDVHRKAFLKEVKRHLLESVKFEWKLLDEARKLEPPLLQSRPTFTVRDLAFEQLQAFVIDQGIPFPDDYAIRHKAMLLYLISTGANRHLESYKHEVERQLELLSLPSHSDSDQLGIVDLCVDNTVPTALDNILTAMKAIVKTPKGMLVAKDQDLQTSFVAAYKLLVNLDKMYDHQNFSYAVIRQVFKKHYSIDISEQVIKYPVTKSNNIKFINTLKSAEKYIREQFPLITKNWHPPIKPLKTK